MRDLVQTMISKKKKRRQSVSWTSRAGQQSRRGNLYVLFVHSFGCLLISCLRMRMLQKSEDVQALKKHHWLKAGDKLILNATKKFQEIRTYEDMINLVSAATLLLQLFAFFQCSACFAGEEGRIVRSRYACYAGALHSSWCFSTAQSLGEVSSC